MVNKIILASKSKVRKKILEENGINCIVEPANIDEDLVKDSLLKEGALPAFSHYLNIRNHLFILRKHPKAFNAFGSWGYQFIKLIGYSLYFILRGRFHKLRMVWKGFYDGLTRKI